jgi:hypothetical protein
MPKNSFNTWVKNVYSLRIQTGKTSGDLYTHSSLARQFTHQPVHNLPVVPVFVPAFAPLLSTSKNNQVTLLNSHLYPQSTPPINKKKKKILGRNT